MKQTFLDRVRESLSSAMTDFNREDVTAQRLVIIPDKTAEWEPIIARLRGTLPIVTFGDYNPSTLTGPAVYIRNLVFHTIESTLPRDQTPIIYLPGYSREQLRNLEECPDEIKPLAGLQYLGEVWSQRNGRDWTILAFLKTSQGGLSIRVNDDPDTRYEIKCAASVIAEESIDFLKSKEPLNAAFFRDLHHPDPNKDILQWMNDPAHEEERMTSCGEWHSFCKICKKEFDFDPEQDGSADAAERLGTQKGKWSDVWERFKEKPGAYPQIPRLLRNVKVPPTITDMDSWPQVNEKREKEIYQALLKLKDLSPDDARVQIAELEKSHAHRREWIWSEMGESPLALALEHLHTLATITQDNKFGGSVEELSERYRKELWRADNAVIRALEHATTKKCDEAISVTINVLYRTWLDNMAQAFQREWIRNPAIVLNKNRPTVSGEVLLFVDGLRMDLGQRLCEMMKTQDCTCTLTHSYSALPSLTSTAKPAVMPIKEELISGEKFTPKTKSGAMANITALRVILEEKGFEVLTNSDTGNPAKSAWTDCANIDDEGHSKGISLPTILERELTKIQDRILELFDAGWKQVHIVTDHGWLLLPGGLRKVELKPGLTDVKKGRCAQLRSGATTDYPTVPWYWDPSILVALAPGSSCFEEGKEYEHGGLSLQEVVIPEIIIQKGSTRTNGIDIRDVSWIGLRCKVQIEGAEGYSIDIRSKPADAKSSLTTGSKTIDIEGNATLVIEDTGMEGEKSRLVILDKTNNPVAQREIIIGGE